MADLRVGLEDTNQLIWGGRYMTSVFDFKSFATTDVWAKIHISNVAVYHCFPDIAMMLGNVKGNYTKWVDVELSKLHAMKCSVSPCSQK